MRFIKKFDKFNEEAQPAPAPSPGTKPSTTPTEPGRRQDPGKRPSPVRRDKPSVAPGPKAKKKSTEKEVAERFIALMDEEGEDIEKYLK